MYNQTLHLTSSSNHTVEQLQNESLNCSYQYTQMVFMSGFPLTEIHSVAKEESQTEGDIHLTESDIGAHLVITNKKDYTWGV